MSVQCNRYIGYGYMFPYKQAESLLLAKMSTAEYEEMTDLYYDSAFKKDIKEVNGCSMLWDGAGGKYMFFGKFFAKSANHEDFDNMVIPKVSAKIKKLVEAEALRLFGTVEGVVPNMMFIAHYR